MKQNEPKLTDKNVFSELTWQVDIEIHSYSQWRVVVVMTWVFIMLLVMSLSGLYWWQWLLVVLVTTGCVVLYQLMKFPVAHLSQPVLKEQGFSPWFIYLLYSGKLSDKDTQNQDFQLWQGHLNKSYASRYFVLLSFDIIEPRKRTLMVSIWRDQVSIEAWRQLQILARL